MSLVVGVYLVSVLIGGTLLWIVQAITSGIVVLFVPGYCLTKLTCSTSVNRASTAAMSVGLSIGIAELLVAALGSLPGGLTSFHIQISVAALAVAMTVAYAYGRSRLRLGVGQNGCLFDRSLLMVVALVALFVLAFYLRARTLSPIPYSDNLGYAYDAPYHFAQADYMSNHDTLSLAPPSYWLQSQIGRGGGVIYPYPFFSFLLIALQKASALNMLSVFKFLPALIASLVPFSWLYLLDSLNFSTPSKLISILLISISSFLLGMLYVSALPEAVALFMIPLIFSLLLKNLSRLSAIPTALLVVSVALTNALALISLAPLPIIVLLLFEKDRLAFLKRVGATFAVIAILALPFTAALRNGWQVFFSFNAGSAVVRHHLSLLLYAVGVELFLPHQRYYRQFLFHNMPYAVVPYLLALMLFGTGLLGVIGISRSREKIELICAYGSSLALVFVFHTEFIAWRIVQLQLPFIVALLVGEGASYLLNDAAGWSKIRLLRAMKNLRRPFLAIMIILICVLSFSMRLYPTGGLASGAAPSFTGYTTILSDGERFKSAGLYIRDNVQSGIPIYLQYTSEDDYTRLIVIYAPWTYPAWLTALSTHVVLLSRPNATTYILVQRSPISVSVYLVTNNSTQLLYIGS
jgi:hypothetical protein